MFESDAVKGKCALEKNKSKGVQKQKVGKNESGSSASASQRGRKWNGKVEIESQDIRKFFKKPISKKIESLRAISPLKKGNFFKNCENPEQCFPATEEGMAKQEQSDLKTNPI